MPGDVEISFFNFFAEPDNRGFFDDRGQIRKDEIARLVTVDIVFDLIDDLDGVPGSSEIAPHRRIGT